MAIRPAKIRMFLALLLSVALVITGSTASAVSSVQPDNRAHLFLAQGATGDFSHATLMAAVSALPDQPEQCGQDAQCCPGQHYCYTALPESTPLASWGLAASIEFTPPFLLSLPSRTPFRPPIA